MNEDLVQIGAQAVAGNDGDQPDDGDYHLARLVIRAIRNAGYRIIRNRHTTADPTDTPTGTTPKEQHVQ